MALDSGALPVALTNTVARVDFNNAMAALDAAFPLQTVNIGLLQITAALLGAQAVETDKIKLLNITAALLGPQAVETAKIKLEAITVALLGPQAVETPKIKLEAITAALLGPQAVETAKIKLLNITAALLATDAVETAKIKNLNVTTGKAALGFGRYVPRITNAYDFAVGAFTTNGVAQVDGLDLSGIVPVGATGVSLYLGLVDDAADSTVVIYTSAAGLRSQIGGATQVANIASSYNGVIPIDANRLLDYFGSNVAFTQINVSVTGWFT